jgi:(5-formylfuran-3-yl)methyl phosphate synthase
VRLLVSVRDEREALDALAGGADVIDVKEPTHGALGAAAEETVCAIVKAIAGRRPVSTVLGDDVDACTIAIRASRAVANGASMVKLGLTGASSTWEAESIIRAGVASARGVKVVVVGYADAERASSLAPEAVLHIAIRAGAHGLVLDTFDKSGPDLFGCLGAHRIVRIITAAREAGLLTGLAGKLGRSHVRDARMLGADLLGVRGAVCESGRAGQLSPARVKELASLLRRETAELVGDPVGVVVGDGENAGANARRESVLKPGIGEVPDVTRRALDEDEAGRAELTGQPGGDAVARDLPGVRERITRA